MARVLLISEDFLRKHIDISDSIISKTAITAIEDAQNFYLSAVIGDKFLKELLREVELDVLTPVNKLLLDTYICPFLMYQSAALLASKVNYKVGNKGVVSNDGVTSPKQIADYYERQTGVALRRLTEYLSRHYNDYKEWLNYNNDTGIKPHLSASDSTSIYLGCDYDMKYPVDPGWRR